MPSDLTYDLIPSNTFPFEIGLDYQGCPFNFTIDNSSVSISNPTGGVCDNLLITYPPLNEKIPLKAFNGNLKLPRTRIVIEPKTPLSCPLPDLTIARNDAVTVYWASGSFLFMFLQLVLTKAFWIHSDWIHLKNILSSRNCHLNWLHPIH